MTDKELWKMLVDCNLASIEASERFIGECQSRVETVRLGLQGTVVEVLTALGLLPRMPESERIALFDDVLRLCIVQKFAPPARQVVLSLSHRWLASNLLERASAVLQTGDHLDHLMMIGMCKEVEPEIALELAQEAAASGDYDIREVGETYIRTLNARP